MTAKNKSILALARTTTLSVSVRACRKHSGLSNSWRLSLAEGDLRFADDCCERKDAKCTDQLRLRKLRRREVEEREEVEVEFDLLPSKIPLIPAHDRKSAKDASEIDRGER
eukprot:748031-Hanusia_phi.AAC.4